MQSDFLRILQIKQYLYGNIYNLYMTNWIIFIDFELEEVLISYTSVAFMRENLTFANCD